MVFSHFDVEFTKDGTVFDASQVGAVKTAAPGLSDLIFISHGWNNNVAEARGLYDAFFASVSAVMGAVAIPGLAGRSFGVVRAFWPRKKFESPDLIRAGATASAAAPAGADAPILLALLERLKTDPERLGGADT